jgi:HEAT repeat protein
MIAENAVLIEYSFADRSAAWTVGGNMQQRGYHPLYIHMPDWATPYDRASAAVTPLIAIISQGFFASPYCCTTLRDAQVANAPLLAIVLPGVEVGALAAYPTLQTFLLTDPSDPAAVNAVLDQIEMALPSASSDCNHSAAAPIFPAYIEDPLPDVVLTPACAFEVIMDWAERTQPLDRLTLRHAVEMLSAYDLDTSIWLLTGLARSGDWRRRMLATVLIQALPVPQYHGIEDVLPLLDSSIRTMTESTLQSMGSAILPTLLHQARSSSWKVRRGAAWALGVANDKAAVPALVKMLRDEDADVARSALLALGEINEKAGIKHIRSLLSHKNFRIAETAAAVLACSGEAGQQALYASITDSSPDIRIMAISGLQRMDTDDRAVRAVILAASDPDPDVRLAAVKALGEIRTDDAVRQLFKSLRDRYISSRAHQRISEVAERILKTLGYNPATDSPPLPATGHSAMGAKNRLAEEVAIRRKQSGAAGTGTLTRRDVDEGIATLIERLDSPMPSARISAVRQLSEIESDVAISAIVPRLVDADSSVAATTSSVLRQLNARALPFVNEMLGTEDLALRGAILSCLGGFANTHAVTLIASCVSDKRPVNLPHYSGTIGGLALKTLSTMPIAEAQEIYNRHQKYAFTKEAAFKHVDASHLYDQAVIRGEKALPLPHGFAAFEKFLNTLSSEAWAEHQAAARDLKEQAAAMYKHNPVEVLAFLRTHSASEHWVVRWACIEALAMTHVKEAATIIVERLNDDNWTVRIAAMRALVEIGERSVTGAVAPLVKVDNESVREAAVETIGALAPEKHLMILIEAAQKDESAFVRLAAVDALGSIDNHKMVLPVLAVALKDTSDNVRWTAAHILSHIADQTITKELIDSLGDKTLPQWETKRVCDLVADALKMIDTIDSRRALEKWYSKNRPHS